MPKPAVRAGETLKVKGRPIPFSIYPVKKTTRRFGLQSKIFATSPWGVMKQVIEDSLVTPVKEQAAAFLEQAQNFYQIASTSHLSPTKPLLFYYSFLNLAKALALVKEIQTSYGRAVHGLTESTAPGGKEFHDSEVAVTWNGYSPRLFNDLKAATTGKTDPKGRIYTLKNVMPQLVPGHRVWCAATGSPERFVEIQRVEFRFNEATKEVWLEINIFSDDLTRFGITRKRLLNESGLGQLFREVSPTETIGDRTLVKFEQIKSVRYTGRPSDKVADLVKILKPYLWFSVMTVSPFRKSYLYLCPPTEKKDMLSQVMSIYLVFFYLGSVTRYRPNLFQEIFESKYGSHLEEVILNLPQQFLYLIASEFSQREVVHAPLV
ncbi:MAG: hypothetical protein KIT42_02765 [Rhodocyclaceae bacterium]|nr:hypothetical protein [Rhodocyclaceae bacterium]MCP5297369.1 hypothetical protein [Zoogloeaceae bacterium]MCW5594776.1 hypothetical protein [Rhodocyclaceae bacterium]